MTRISVAEAAERLQVDVTRVRQRIADGSLAAEKVGHQWVIEEGDVGRIDRKSAGRPLSSRSAWALVWAARCGKLGTHHNKGSDNASVGPLPFGPAERSRARARLSQLLQQVEVLSDPLVANTATGEDSTIDDDLAAGVAVLTRLLLTNRAQRLLFRCSPRDLADLRDDNRLKLAGISLDAAGIAAGDMVEAYLPASYLDRLVEEFLLVEADSRSANVVLHVVTREEPQLVTGGDNWLLLAADLAEYHRPRENVRAAQLLCAAARRRSSVSSGAVAAGGAR